MYVGEYVQVFVGSCIAYLFICCYVMCASMRWRDYVTDSVYVI